MNLVRQTIDRFTTMHSIIGNTPMFAIHCRFKGKDRTIYAKAEYLNLTGSIKDRMALHVLECAYREGNIACGGTIAEASSGNTGISFAAIGQALGHPVVIFMPDWMSPERTALIRSLGARVVHVSETQGGFLGSIDLCETYAKMKLDVFLPRQFSNDANAQAHEQTTGPEIGAQIESIGGTVAAFVAGVGTGGTVMGVGRYLRTRYPYVRLHPLEPAESPTLTTGIKIGRHRIQGISDEFVPALCRLDQLDSIVSVADGDAILMAQQLAATLGLGVGVSSGANLVGALMVQDELATDDAVVTIFCDDNKKYLSTDLVREEPIKSNYLTPAVELKGYEVIARSR